MNPAHLRTDKTGKWGTFWSKQAIEIGM